MPDTAAVTHIQSYEIRNRKAPPSKGGDVAKGGTIEAKFVPSFRESIVE